ncbi:MAG: ABC transporter substrate-binding protein, partial [Rhodospirillales bacterium]
MTGNEPSVDRPSWFRLALTWGILGAFVIATIVYFSIKLFAPGVPVIRVGLVGPMTGPAAEQGAEMLAGAQAMLAKANGEEVLGRYRIELVVKDDQNDPERAKTLAAELADQTDVVAVLGPLTDETALAAGPVYADRKLTAVIGGSGLADVTFKNPYFFRTGLSTEIQGKLLAHYISRVLKVEKLIMIRDDSQYAESFFVAFENEISVLKRLGTVKTTIDKTFPFKAKAKSVDERIVQIAENLSVQYLGETILLITDSAQAGNVIRQLKDRPRRRLGRIIPYTFIGPDTLAQPEFRKMFAGLRRERDRPGFYAEGVHTVAPFLSDVVNKEAVGFLRNFEAQNGRQPGGVAADYYDAAKAVMEAIRRSSYATQPAAKVRTEVRDLVAAIDSSEKALDGVSGSLHFDLDGNAVKWVPIGVYRNGGLVSPQIQLVPVSTQEINDDADILQVGGQFFTRTKVIYTGVRLNEINSVDFAERRYNADVNIWFRFPGELDFSAIEFPDALEPLALGDPLSASDQDSGAYRMFHIAAPFKAEVNKEGRRELLLQLRHRDLNRNNIIFVPDIQGMATGGEGTFYDRTRLAVRLDGNTNWRVGAIRVFQDIEPVQTLGNPRYAAGDVAGFSRFNLSVGLENMESTVLDRFGFDVAIAVFLLVGIAASVVHLAALKRTRTHVRRILWLPESVLILCCLLAAEATVLGWLSTHAEGRDYLEPAITTFQVLWWMIPTWLIVQAVERFIWRPLELRTGRVVPRVVRVFAAMILYTIGGLGVVAFVFDQTVTSLLATSGVLAMILGLAIQMNLSNVFSGLAINVETPFRIGDWIKVGDYEPGEVVAITWRTTRLRTRDSNIICIPNSVASDSTVENFSYPEETYRLELMVHADPGARPQWVEKILRDAITSTAGIHKKPLPEIVFTGVQEWSAAYAVRFFVDNYPASIEVQAAAWRDIVRNMR